MSHSGWVHVDAKLIERETEKCFLFVFEHGKTWLPKSQLLDPERLEVGDRDITVTMTDFIAKQRGLD